MTMPSVSFVSLGCAKNLVDTEVMIAQARRGRLASSRPTRAAADTVVINTCAFIDPAKAESTETILEHAARKAAAASNSSLRVAWRSDTANSCRR